MDIFEEARSIKKMIEMSGMTQEKLADILGVSQSYIANKLRLLGFSEEAQKKICEYGLSARHARCILRLKNEEDRIFAIEKIHSMKMNVERTEILVDCLLTDKKFSEIAMVNQSERIGKFEETLENSLLVLREHGIYARSKREEFGKEIYFTIRIG